MALPNPTTMRDKMNRMGVVVIVNKTFPVMINTRPIKMNRLQGSFSSSTPNTGDEAKYAKEVAPKIAPCNHAFCDNVPT